MIAPALCVATLLLLATPLLAASGPAAIPFTTNSDGMVLMPAKVSGITIQVIFDTGAGIDVFAPSLIEKVHGKPAGQFTGFRATGERLDLSLFIIPELAVGPVIKKDVLVAAWDVLDKFHLDGIVSLNDFRQQPVTFDFANQRLIFETEKSIRRRRTAGAASPLQFDDERGISLDIFTQFLLVDQPGQCLIDTGSPNATLSTRYMNPLHIDKNSSAVHKHEGTTIAGAKEVRWGTSISEISLAAAPQIKLAPVRVSFSDIIYDCVVGVDFWHDRALTIDIASRQLIVSTPERKSAGASTGN